MDTANKFLVGHVAKTHGLHGLFSIKLNTPFDLFPLFKHLQIIYIEDSLIPLSISNIKLKPKVFITIQTQNILNRDHAKKILRKNVYIKIGDHKLIDDALIKKTEFIGYKLCDLNKDSLGQIIDVIYNSPQPLFIVKGNKKNIQIPYVKELIVEIDRKKQIIHVDLPEGLTEICVE